MIVSHHCDGKCYYCRYKLFLCIFFPPNVPISHTSNTDPEVSLSTPTLPCNPHFVTNSPAVTDARRVFSFLQAVLPWVWSPSGWTTPKSRRPPSKGSVWVLTGGGSTSRFDIFSISHSSFFLGAGGTPVVLFRVLNAGMTFLCKRFGYSAISTYEQ